MAAKWFSRQQDDTTSGVPASSKLALANVRFVICIVLDIHTKWIVWDKLFDISYVCILLLMKQEKGM